MKSASGRGRLEQKTVMRPVGTDKFQPYKSLTENLPLDWYYQHTLDLVISNQNIPPDPLVLLQQQKSPPYEVSPTSGTEDNNHRPSEDEAVDQVLWLWFSLGPCAGIWGWLLADPAACLGICHIWYRQVSQSVSLMQNLHWPSFFLTFNMCDITHTEIWVQFTNIKDNK